MARFSVKGKIHLKLMCFPVQDTSQGRPVSLKGCHHRRRLQREVLACNCEVSYSLLIPELWPILNKEGSEGEPQEVNALEDDKHR